MPIDSGLAECPHCRTPAGAHRVRRIGHMLAGVGIVCAFGTYFGWGMLQSWLVGEGFNSTVLSYLFWMFFIGGWLMIGLGSLLRSAKPVRGFQGDSGGADKSEGETEPSGEVPYGIDKRPMPTGDDLETLLPRQVGQFGRGEIPRRDSEVNVTYRAGESEISVEFGISDSADAAQEGLTIVKGNTTGLDIAIQAWSIGTEPSFLKAGHVLMVWTRGGYYFSAHAESEADLDAFMEAFPY